MGLHKGPGSKKVGFLVGPRSKEVDNIRGQGTRRRGYKRKLESKGVV